MERGWCFFIQNRRPRKNGMGKGLLLGRFRFYSLQHLEDVRASGRALELLGTRLFAFAEAGLVSVVGQLVDSTKRRSLGRARREHDVDGLGNPGGIDLVVTRAGLSGIAREEPIALKDQPVLRE